MSNDFGEGIFSMAMVTFVSKQRDLNLAKDYALAAIDENTVARLKNKEKARALVRGSRTVNSLALGMSNFSLSHQGLKTIR